jgi:hypothetical protein
VTHTKIRKNALGPVREEADIGSLAIPLTFGEQARQRHGK